MMSSSFTTSIEAEIMCLYFRVYRESIYYNCFVNLFIFKILFNDSMKGKIRWEINDVGSII